LQELELCNHPVVQLAEEVDLLGGQSSVEANLGRSQESERAAVNRRRPCPLRRRHDGFGLRRLSGFAENGAFIVVFGGRVLPT
jgi:hypothetical protein